MSDDISQLLRDWPFEPGKINARVVTSPDGSRRIQVRIDLGILQMFPEGRPDGLTPFGFPSLLEFHESRLDELRQDAAGDPESGEAEPPKDPESFSLTPEECRALRDEAVQFYHRYVALLALEDFEGVIQDTSRNLRVLDFCKKHAEREEDRTILEQFRPYITMLRSRAYAGLALKENEPKAAVLALEEGLDTLRKYFAEHNQPQLFEQSNEVQMLRTMRDALVPKLPVSQKAELHARLERALSQENYELAAILRDELRMLKEA